MKTALTIAAIALGALHLPAPSAAGQLRAVPFVRGVNLPVEFAQDPSDPSVQYVVEQAGLIRVVKSGVLQTTPFLDVSARLSLGGERGLLGLALPRDYGATGRFYIYYTRSGDPAPSDEGDIVVARYTRSSGNPLVADPASAAPLVFGTLGYIEHSGFGNHNGGRLAFGPDGYLYIAVGDGGGGQDPTNNAQNPATLLGKILRVDVSVPVSHAAGYVVPPDNPFVDGDPVAALPEIWAFGVRNPWKFSFDDVAGGTNALLIADVGQGAWEEVNYEPANSGGRNYGWRNREGAHDNQGNVHAPVAPAYQPLTDPIYEYSHSVGGSITGGFVYRGPAMSASFRGRYFFADFIRGRVWSIGLSIDGGSGAASARDLVEHTADLGGSAALGAISSFGRDSRGELYIVSYAGTIFRIVDVSPREDAQLVVFNFNRDARKDVLVYYPASGAWSVRLGNGSGTFDDGPSGGWAAGWQVSKADFNGDGLDDFFLYNPATGSWFKVINTGAGFSYFTQQWQPGFTVFVVDLNADGKSDVFVYSVSSGAWFTCISTGTGIAGFDYGAGGWRPGWQVLPADFDGDGRSDFLLYDDTSGAFYKAITRGNGLFQYSGGGWAAGWSPAIAALNGDGLDDVFLYNAVVGTWYRCTSIGDGTTGFAYTAGGWAPGWQVDAADFDGNGLTDFFLYHSSGEWYKAVNNGSTFSYFRGGWAQWIATVEDLDGDGLSDIFLYDSASGVWYQAFTTTPGAFRYTSGVFRRQ